MPRCVTRVRFLSILVTSITPNPEVPAAFIVQCSWYHVTQMTPPSSLQHLVPPPPSRRNTLLTVHQFHGCLCCCSSSSIVHTRFSQSPHYCLRPGVPCCGAGGLQGTAGCRAASLPSTYRCQKHLPAVTKTSPDIAKCPLGV